MHVMRAKMEGRKIVKTFSIEIGKYYRTEDGKIYKVIGKNKDDIALWVAAIRKGISQQHPVIIVDEWGRNKFRQDLIEEVEYED